MATTTSLETSSPRETEAAGEELGRRLRKGDLVLLRGELGAGKTTFVRGIARGCGSAAQVASPTFQLVRIYPGRLQIAHVDLYRLEKGGELRDLGLDELLDAGAVVVEWGDRIDEMEEAGGADAAMISIEHLGGDRRLIRTDRDLRR
ncbi:MAG TPA: tRNA (adenosine(37)-N6)-threonylcarbamoyltransferase complex ATPase subunit type 1 TsaE [Candidatus Dormibacteraeota bacterium]